MSINNAPRKQKAIELRKKGKSYSEILKTIPVAKSTLCLWLKSVGLSKPQQQRLTEKRLQSAQRGGDSRRAQRITETKEILEKARREIGKITNRELLLIGAALYWAEGSKQKSHAVSTGILFTNSDPQMLILFLRWLSLLKIPREQILFELYVHENSKERLSEMKLFWSKLLKSSITDFERVYFKKDKKGTLRKNVGVDYHGLIRIKVRASTNLNRRVNGFILGICDSR